MSAASGGTQGGSGSSSDGADSQPLQQPQPLGTVLPPTSNLLPARPWYAEPCVLGIDEAGRGPVLGAMVYAVAAAPLSYKDELARQSYADSKTLTEAQRSRLFAALAADPRCAYAAELLPADGISGQMLGRCRVSLNAIAEASTLRLIQAALDAGVMLTEVYVDTVGDADRYRQRLSSAFPALSFTVCPKADGLFPIVSAASIAAKVLRDTSLLVDAEALPPSQRNGDGVGGGGAGLGNGYPGDATTQAWLARACHPVWGFPSIVRFSWETATRIMDERCFKAVWAGDADGGSSSGGQQQTLTCFKAAGDNSAESSGLGRHPYFRLRRLQRVAAF